MYTVREHVYREDVNGRMALRYATGDVITDNDAKRAGLVKGKPSDKTPPKGVTIAPPAGTDVPDDTPPAPKLVDRNTNLSDLRDICATEEIDPEGANTRAEYRDVIEAARIAKADKGDTRT